MRERNWPPQADPKKDPNSPENRRRSAREVVFNGGDDPEHPDCVDQAMVFGAENPDNFSGEEKALMRLHLESSRCSRCLDVYNELVEKTKRDFLYPDNSGRLKDLKKAVEKAS